MVAQKEKDAKDKTPHREYEREETGDTLEQSGERGGSGMATTWQAPL
jgi:hypothetical protein